MNTMIWCSELIPLFSNKLWSSLLKSQVPYLKFVVPGFLIFGAVKCLKEVKSCFWFTSKMQFWYALFFSEIQTSFFGAYSSILLVFAILWVIRFQAPITWENPHQKRYFESFENAPKSQFDTWSEISEKNRAHQNCIFEVNQKRDLTPFKHFTAPKIKIPGILQVQWFR